MGIVEKAQEASSDTGMHGTVACAIAVIHEQWLCRETPTSQVTI